MIDRPIQAITSPYGPRKMFGGFHNGIDLRNWDDDFRHRLPVILPEGAVLKEMVYEDTWGWTFKFTPLTSGIYEIRFTHMAGNPKLKLGEVYDARMKIGYNAVTPYMASKKLGEHLHFSTWSAAGEHFNPCEYYDRLKIQYETAKRR